MSPPLVGSATACRIPAHVTAGLSISTPGNLARRAALLSTVGRHRCTGALLAPASGWCTRPYSTLLPYRADGERATSGLWPEQPDRAHGADPQVACEAVRQEPLVFAVMEKRARAPWAPIGRLVLDLPMPDGAADDGPHGADPVTFDPVVHATPDCGRCGRSRRSGSPRTRGRGAAAVHRRSCVRW